MPVSSTALRSRPNETFQTGCVTKRDLIKTCMYTSLLLHHALWIHLIYYTSTNALLYCNSLKSLQ